MAKTNIEDIDRNIYDIKNKDNYEFKMQKGLNKEIVEDKNSPESSGIKRRFWAVLKFVSRI